MAFRILNKDLKFPTPYPRVERQLATVKKKSHIVVGGHTLRKNKDYIPQPGLQEDVCASECNLIFMCGQGTAGKTFALYFKALGGMDKYGFTARIISYQSKDNKKGSSMLRDGITVCGNFGGCEQVTSGDYPTFSWPRYNSNLQLIHNSFNGENPKEFEDFMEYAKKQQASLIMIDEATAINTFNMFTFWFMRNRDESGMIPQMILTFNPKHTHWTTAMLRDAGFLDEQGFYLNPDMIGKVRYFYIKGDNPEGIVWGATRQEVVEAAGLVLKPEDAEVGMTVYDYVKSFTVFTGTAAGNRELVNATGGQSVANLHAVGATQRAVVGEAYFGPIDNEEINVNRQMIHSLWENPICGNPNERYATLDVSRSVSEKSDDSPLVIWHGLRIVKIIMLHVDLKTLVATIHRILNEEKVPIENFAFDGGGIGEYLQDFTEGNPIKGNRSVIQEYDKYGNPFELERYYDLRSQLHGKMEAMLRRNEISCDVGKQTQLKYGKNGGTRALIDILFDEIYVFTTIDKNGKIYYRNKKEYKQKFKSSPDLMDAIVMRSFFELDARPKKQPKPIVSDSVYRNWVHPPKIVNPWKGRFR